MGDRALSEEQARLVETVVSTPRYVDALRLLKASADLVDDHVLATFAGLSQAGYQDGRYKSAAALADLASRVDRHGTTETRIDLHIAAGQSYARLDRRGEARRSYKQAEALARGSGSSHGLALALAMLAQLSDRRATSDKPLGMLREAIEIAQQPGSGTSDDDLWTFLLLYARLSFDQGPDEAVWRRLLQLIQPAKLTTLRARFNDLPPLRAALVEDEALRMLVLDDFDRDDFDTLHDVLIAEVGRESKPSEATRASTDVLMDRVMGDFSLRSFHISIKTVEMDLAGLSVLIHEFTHFWTLSGSLGGYFSELVGQLYHLRISLDLLAKERSELADDPEAMRALRSFFESSAKLQCFWLTWQPWMEGVALFSETDLDLTEPGGDELPLPVSMLLAVLPSGAPTAAAVKDGRGLEATIDRQEAHIARTRALQRRCADARSTTLHGILVGPRATGNEDSYFAGLTLIRLLRQTWAQRCPALANSITFSRLLIWLTHSAFDDLLPDWRCAPDEFCRRLQAGFSAFLARLLDLAPDQLAEAAAVLAGSEPAPFDLWRHWTPGHGGGSRDKGWRGRLSPILSRLTGHDARQRAPGLWEARVTRLRREFAETATSTSERYLRRMKPHFDELTAAFMRNNTLHMLTQSEVAFRLIARNRWLVASVRSRDSQRASLFVRTLDQTHFAQLSEECGSERLGAGRFYQFLLLQPDPQVKRLPTFIAALRYGATLLVWSGDNTRAPDDVVRLVGWFLDETRARMRQRVLADIAIGTGSDVETLVQAYGGDAAAAMTAAFDRQLTPLVASHEAAIERLCLRPLAGDDERADQLRNERVAALLPREPLARRRALRMLWHLGQAREGLSRAALASELGWSSEAVDALVADIETSSAAWHQALLVEQNGLICVRFPNRFGQQSY